MVDNATINATKALVIVTLTREQVVIMEPSAMEQITAMVMVIA